MKESKFVKTKIVAGYLLLIAVCILSVGYVYRVAVRFSAPDRSYALLHTKRSAVNRTLYHLYQAESYGQLMIAGWMPGSTNPAEPGEFAAYVDLGDGKLLKRFFDWDGQHWMMPGGIEAQAPVVWWMRLPPVPSAKKGADI